MDCASIPYSRVPKTSALLNDYLYHFEKVSRFYNHPPYDPASYKAAAAGTKISHRKKLADILLHQNREFGAAEAALANIRLLEKGDTFAVVTGQQVGLFSGPAFTLYKALTAVKLAASLSEQGIRCVPVFWLATEDHDLEEVSHAAVFDEQYGLAGFASAGVRPAEHCSVGYVKFSEEITATLDKLESLLPPGEPRERLMRDLRESYAPGSGWGQAFGKLMARIFSRWGVILLDPLDEEIHRLAAPVFDWAISDTPALRDRLLKRSADLVNAGYHAQVHVGEDSTPLFVARNGNRTPIRLRGDELWIDETERVSPADLRTKLNSSPIDFTANAVMRPLVQDTVLPTVAYVAGPSELTYFAQAQAVYGGFGREMPVIFPRAAFTLVDRRVERWMDKYQVTVEDAWAGREHLRQKIAAAGLTEGGAQGWSERFDASEQELVQVLDRMRRDVKTLDPTLLDALTKIEDKMKYEVEKLRGKISRAAVQKSDLLARHEESLARFLWPNKDLQEREVSGICFLARAGYELLDRLLEQTQLRSPEHQVVVY